MAYEMKDMEGSIFRNDRREEGSNQPTHSGQCKIDGVEYWISAWVNEIKSGPNQGGKFFSLRFREKDNGFDRKTSRSESVAEDFDDDIPF